MQQDFQSFNSPDGNNKSTPPKDHAEGILSRLNSDFILIGKTRVHSWRAWLLIGIAAGAAAGILLVANRSGELDMTGAESGPSVVSPTSVEDITYDLLELGAKINAIEEASPVIEEDKQSSASGAAIILAQRSSSDTPEVKAAVSRAVDVAKQRQRLLQTRLLQDRAEEVLKYSLPKDIRDDLPEEVQPYLESDVSINGEFEVSHADYQDGTAKFIHSVEAADGKRMGVYFAGRKPEDINSARLKTGARVKVSGLQVGEALAVEAADNGVQVLAAPQVSSSLGTQKTAVFVLSFQNAPSSVSVSVSQARDVVFNSNSSVNKFYEESSYGEANLAGEVLGPYVIPMNGGPSCDYYGMALKADQMASAAGVNVSQYSRKVYAIPPNNNCPWWGLGTIGGSPSMSWIHGSFVNGVVSHELGHNVGLYHSHSYDCGSAALGNNCTSYEYGDIADVMGSATPPKHFNAVQKDRLGWLNYKDAPPITNVTADGTYTIYAYETASSTSKALKIVRPGTISDAFYVELRQPIGFDVPLAAGNANIRGGVLMHYQPSGSPSQIYLLDMTPETSSFFDPALLPGKTFQDPNSKLLISVTSVDQSKGTAVVNVTLGVGACIRQNPSLSLSPSGQFAQAGDTKTYSASVTNNDSATCGSSSFNLNGSGLPAGWIITYGNVSVAAGGTGKVSIDVTSPLNAPEASYNLTVTAVNSNDSSKSASASAAYNVEPTPPPPPPPPPGNAFNDDFNRADSDSLGNSWEAVSGQLSIVSNEARNPAVKGMNLVVSPDAEITDGKVGASFASLNNNNGPQFGVILRYQDANNYYKVYRTTGGSSRLYVAKVVNGVQTNLKGAAIKNPAKNSYFRIEGEAEGQNISLVFNGATKIVVNDATFSKGKSGIIVGAPTRAIKSHRIDDFRVSSGSSAPDLTFRSISLPTNTLANGKSIVFRFAANAGATGAKLYNLDFVMSQMGIKISRLDLYSYTDASFSMLDQTFALVSPGVTQTASTISVPTLPSMTIPSGTTKYIELRATVLQATSGDYVTTQFSNLPLQTLSR